MKKNDTIKRVKFIAKQTKGYAKMVGRLINDVMHPAIKSKEEVLEKLTTTPSVEDIVKIFNELHNKVVPSLEMGVDYKVYNQENKYGHSIIYFFDNENDELPEDELSKVWDILNNGIDIVSRYSTTLLLLLVFLKLSIIFIVLNGVIRFIIS